MPPEETGRRLAAVWFADVVGYTALSNADEDAAVRIIADFQRLSQEAAAAQGGRVVKYIGDAVLAEFGSTDGGLRAALDVLAGFEALEDVKATSVGLRIGMHVGEVVGSDDGDIYGDGVNFASRLENAAAPGRVFVSEAIYTQIRQRSVFEARSVGSRRFKGIPGACEVFEVAYQGQLRAELPAPPPPRPTSYWPRSRAIAMGLTTAVVAFLSLVVWNAFKNQEPLAFRTNYAYERVTYSGTAEAPRFSPDGAALAVLEANERFGGDLSLCRLDAGDVACSPTTDGVTAFDWSAPDSLAFAASGRVYHGPEGADRDDAEVLGTGWDDFVISAESNTATRVEHSRAGSTVIRQALGGEAVDTVLSTPPGTRIWDFAWSPAGDRLLASFTDASGAASLRLYPEAGDPVTLVSQRVSNPRWSHDGAAVYFLRDLGIARVLHALPIDRSGEPIFGPRPVLAGRNVESFDIGPDGSIAYSEVQRESNLVGVRLANGPDDGTTGTPESITTGTARISAPALLPGGARLAYVRNGDVYVVTGDGPEERLTRLQAPISGLRWSPDGEFLAFIVQENSRRELHFVDADPAADVASRPVPLSQPLPYDSRPELAWADGGDAVVYVGADPAGWPSILSKVDTRTERDEVLIQPDSAHSPEAFTNLVSSPDGSRVVVGDGVGGLRFVSADDGSTEHRYPDTPGLPVHWGADGRIVIRSLLDAGELRTLHADSARTTFLARLPEGCDELSIDPEGDRLVCSIPAPPRRDVWIARPGGP